MSGQAGIRGYFVQTLLALLESLGNHDWTELTIEPDLANEKIDILWTFPTGRLAVQVKHSQNQITVGMAKAWAEELDAALAGPGTPSGELRLVGHHSKELLTEHTIGRVKVPRPEHLSPEAFLERAAHRLDRYLESIGVSKVPVYARELLVGALTTRLSQYSTRGTALRRNEFEKLLREWVSILYPVATDAAERIERLRYQLLQLDRASRARYELKYDACLKTLELMDRIMTARLLPWEVKPDDTFEFARMARECRTKLVLACDRADVLAVFLKMLGQHSVDQIVDLRSAVRQELGFGEDMIDSDRTTSFIATVDLTPYDIPEEVRKKLDALHKSGGDGQ